MAVVTEVLARISADPSRFISGMDSAASAARHFEGATVSAEGRSRGLFSTMAGATAVGGLLANGFSMATGQVTRFGSEIIHRAMDMQQTEIAFTNLMGSASLAKDELKQLNDFAAVTPFEFPQLANSTKMMMSMGFSASEVLRKVKGANGKVTFEGIAVAAGDAASASGRGAEGIDTVVRALGRMKSKGRTGGEELQSLAEMSIPVWDILATTLGKSTAEVHKMSEKGLIPAKTAIDAITGAIEHGSGKWKGFGGMMDQQSRSLAGLISTLKDTIYGQFVSASGPLIDLLSTMTQKLIDIAAIAIPKLVAAITGAITWVGKFASQIKDGFQGIGDAANPFNQFGQTIRSVFDSVLVAWGQFKVGFDLGGVYAAQSPIAFKIGAMFATAFKWFIDNKDAIVTALGAVLTAILAYKAISTVTSAIEGLVAAFRALAVIDAVGFALVNGATAMGALGAGLAALGGPVILVVAAIALLAAGFYLAYTHIQSFHDAVDSFASVMAGIVSGVLAQLAAWFSGTLMPIIMRVASVVTSNLMPAFTAIAGFISGSVLPGIVSLAQTFQTSLLPGILSVVTFLTRLIGKIFEFYSFVLGKIIPVVLQLAGPAFGLLISALSTIWNVIGQVLSFIGMLGNTIMDLIDGNISFGEAVSTIWNGFLSLIMGVGGAIGGYLLTLGQTFISWIGPAIAALPGMLASFGSTLLGWVSGAAVWLGTNLLNWGTAMLSWIGTAIAGLPSKLGYFLGYLLGWIVMTAATLPSRMMGWVTGLLTWAYMAASQLPGKAAAVASALWGWVSSTASQLPGKALALATNITLWVGTAVNQLPGKLAGLASSIGSWISTTAGTVIGQAQSIGSNLVTGLWNGISNLKDWIINNIAGFGASIIQGAKDALGVKSPSVYTIEMGKFLVAGLAIGINRHSKMVETAAAVVAGKALAAMNKAQTVATAAGEAVIRAQAAVYTAHGSAAVERAKKALEKAQAFQQKADALLALAKLNQEKAAKNDPLTATLNASQAALDKWKRKAKDALDYMASVQGDMAKFGSISTYAPSGPRGANATDMLANMQQRLAQIKKFGADISALQKAGLLPAVLQDIIGMGPVAGAQYAEALLAQPNLITGPNGINDTYTAIQKAAAATAGSAGAGVFGMNQAQANGVMNSTVNIANGAVTVNIAPNVSAADRTAINKDIVTEVTKALKALAQEKARR